MMHININALRKSETAVHPVSNVLTKCMKRASHTIYFVNYKIKFFFEKDLAKIESSGPLPIDNYRIVGNWEARGSYLSMRKHNPLLVNVNVRKLTHAQIVHALHVCGARMH